MEWLGILGITIGVALLAIVVTTAPFVLLTWGTPRLALTSADGNLVVKLGGRDAVVAFRRSVTIPLDQIAAAQVMARTSVRRRGLRLPGTEIPGFVRAGSYGRGRSREFWDVRRGAELLVIDTAGAAPYARLVLEVEDPAGTAAWLRAIAGA